MSQGMRSASRTGLLRVGFAATLLLLMTAGSTFAEPVLDPLFDMTWTGPYGTGSAVLTATLEGTNEYLVTSITGTQDALSLTLLALDAYGSNDNYIYQPPTYTNLVDFAGFAFTDGVNDYNIFFYTLPSQSNTYTECSSAAATTCTGGNVNDGLALSSLAITPATSPVPEPGTSGLLALGLVGLVSLAWRRRKDPGPLSPTSR
jgi:hypothetical protein